MDIPTLIELYGLPGLIIGGLAWWGRAERQERKEAQKQVFDLATSMKDTINDMARQIERSLS